MPNEQQLRLPYLDSRLWPESHRKVHIKPMMWQPFLCTAPPLSTAQLHQLTPTNIFYRFVLATQRACNMLKKPTDKNYTTPNRPDQRYRPQLPCELDAMQTMHPLQSSPRSIVIRDGPLWPRGPLPNNATKRSPNDMSMVCNRQINDLA